LARIRLPSSFGSGVSQQNDDDGVPEETKPAAPPSITNGDVNGNNNDKEGNEKVYSNTNNLAPDQEKDFETIFNQWLRQDWSDKLYASVESNDDDQQQQQQQQQSQVQNKAESDNDIQRQRKRRQTYELPLSPLAFGNTQQYLSLLENRLKKIRRFQTEFHQVVIKVVCGGWKATNDVVRYKFPVGIVTAWSVLRVAKKISNIRFNQRKKNGRNGNKNGSNGIINDDDNDDNNMTKEDNMDTYKHVLRHTGRALDLDSDDLSSYRHHGGIERVRSRLIRSVLEGELETIRNNNDNLSDVDVDVDTDDVCDDDRDRREIEQLLEALAEALSLEFIPGGSHSDYIRRMIPSFSRAENWAHRLGISQSSNCNGGINGSDIDNDADLRLLAIALQTAEVRILDSQLRSIRDRLIRTTYRLNRTVLYWKSKVESTRLSSSLTATITGLSARRDLLPNLNRKWSRFFFLFGSGGPQDKNSNSLLEGDRLRLAFSEAAYNAEIVRLGKVLNLLSQRPEEMPDSTLTTALVDQKKRKGIEQAMIEEAFSDASVGVGDCGGDSVTSVNSSSSSREEGTLLDVKEESVVDGAGRNIRTSIIAMRDGVRNRIANRLGQKRTLGNAGDNSDQNEKHITRMVGAFSSFLLASVKPVRGATMSMMKAFNQRIKQKKKRGGMGIRTRSKRFGKYFAIRFNADGRRKFSVQNFDEDTVTIESDTALDVLLHRTDYDQRPWLRKADAWSLAARGLIMDTIRETVEASIISGSASIHNNGITSPFSATTNKNKKSSRVTQLAKLELELEYTWRVRQYGNCKGENSDTKDTLAKMQPQHHTLFPHLLSSLSSPTPLSPSVASSTSIHQRQWTLIYEMSRDINRLRRVGEGKSLKFKWKEVHWIHWLMQWNLMGIPLAALKIMAAFWIHDNLQPHVPKIKEITQEVHDAGVEIFTTRFWTPLKDLVDEIMSRRKGLVTGVSLAEEEASLDIMLHDLGLGDGTPATRHEATIKATRQYESHMKSGLMWHALGGQLVRLMLVQMQQLKVSMLDAAETIDVLFQSNRINMQVMAVVPAVGIVFFGTKVLVRFLFSIRAKEFRPIASVHADMTDYLNKLESNIILRTSDSHNQQQQQQPHPTHSYSYQGRTDKIHQRCTGKKDTTANLQNGTTMPTTVAEEKQLGEFALILYKYLLLLDYSSPQLLPSRQCDVIHQSLTEFLGRKGSFRRDNSSTNDRIRLIDLVKGKHQDLSKNF